MKSILLALEALQQGKMIIVTDDPNRENEGDLIMLADRIQPADMNFIIRNTSGIVCVSISEETATRLALPSMVAAGCNTSARETPFTVSIDAKEGVTTGVSAADRTLTSHLLADKSATADSFVTPGHLFPLVAKQNGVLARQGHTEAGFDLARLATGGASEAAVLCELMNADGTMMHGEALHAFAKAHQLLMISIAELIAYRQATETQLEETSLTTLPIQDYGDFQCRAYRETISGREHLVLSIPPKNAKPALVRIHSSCTTGDIFASLRCDCHQQLHYALKKISEEGGVLIYLSQEGRGIGLGNKINAYALQSTGLDTVEANIQLGLPVDAREYKAAAEILSRLHLSDIRLLTNNPAKVDELTQANIGNVTREAMPVFTTDHNQHYLAAKRDKLHHFIQMPNAAKQGNAK